MKTDQPFLALLHETTDGAIVNGNLQSDWVFEIGRDFNMRNIRAKKTAVKDWMRLAAKLSLLFTEPKTRAALGDQLKDRVEQVADTISDRYDDLSDTVVNKYEATVDRLESAVDALQGKVHWSSRVTGFLLGIGVGAGLGLLFAPASGSQLRESVRSKAGEVTSKIRESVMKMPSTGTEG